MGTRLSVDPSTVTIDNRYYDDIHDRWWSTGEGPVAGLHAMNPTRASYFESALATRRPLAGTRILDVGCGGGILAEELARRGADVTGIDFSVSSLAAANRHASRTGATGVRYAACDALALPFEAGSFDAIVSSDFLEHVPDLGRCVGEMSRVLKPGGVLAFDTINRTLISWVIVIGVLEVLTRRVPRHTHDRRLFVKPRELEAALRDAGLTLVETRGLSPKGFPLANLVKVWRGFDLRFAVTNDRNVSYLGYATKPSA